MNLYFLMIGLLQLWSVITPVNPLSTWGAIGFIFALSASKEAVDDYRRYARDKKANTRPYYVIRNGRKQKIHSEDILVGDLLYLENNDEVPCDIVVLGTSDHHGLCYVQTANLDGETDYKQRRAPQATMSMRLEELARFKGAIECAPPNAEIYRFDSRMTIESEIRSSRPSDWITLSPSNTLLQATHLRNTDFVYGLVVYTGNETKIGKNKKLPPCKWTKLDKAINRITMFIFIFQLSLVVVFGLIGESFRARYGQELWYVAYPYDLYDVWYAWMIIPLRFLLLNSTMIPISLKVTMDVIKYAYSIIIEWDLQMYYAPTDTPTTVNNTAISEDLGQIEYLFTDKTGTLTENVMLFKRCYVNGKVYSQNEADDRDLLPQVESDVHMREFFRALALCHTVVPENVDGKIIYKSSSPDEEALVIAASRLEVKFVRRDFDTVGLSVFGNSEEYDWLHVLDFTSERKRMSVIVRDRKTGHIHMYIKGADDVIFPRLREDYSEAQRYIEEFAQQGLRTLCVASRHISDEEYQHWQSLHQEAVTSLENRAAKLAHVYEALEKDLLLVGITAIEDKLQDEVPETIAVIRAAGVRVWMLTGDKYSTAVQIGIACNLIARDKMEGELLTVARSDQIPSLTQKAKGFISAGKTVTVIVEGHVLQEILTVPEPFMELAMMANTVICCRVTPTQKAEIVANVKRKKFVTLAIGDGGNDVGMIQEADIGVGIAGREGMQAARAADYSFGRFKFLQRLMLIHGRYSYHRTAFVANYSFYKSLFICFMQIFYQFYTEFSGTTFFNSLCLMSYNVIFTGLPVMGFIFDKDLAEATISSNPFLYRDSQSGRSFNLRVFTGWFIRAFLQALVVFLVTVSVYLHETGSDYATIALPAFTIGIIVQSLTVAIESHYLTYINQVLIWGTLISYFVVISIANTLPQLDMYSSMVTLYSTADYWFCILIVSAAALLPVIAVKYFYYNYFPSPSQILSYLNHFSIPFRVPFLHPSPSIPSLSSSRRHNPNRKSFLFTDPDSQWVVQMIKFEEPEEWGGEGGKQYTTTDKTPLLLDGRER
eukprot:Phypoly_transcript_00876.p1 GENE.Phypoly_transcript_00876~~Phypoly_transcript_00876.p1  ORF type:complete len:1138 (+),score=165.10 Phypoly_transcript_00876:253-3414(+)